MEHQRERERVVLGLDLAPIWTGGSVGCPHSRREFPVCGSCFPPPSPSSCFFLSFTSLFSAAAGVTRGWGGSLASFLLSLFAPAFKTERPHTVTSSIVQASAGRGINYWHTNDDCVVWLCANISGIESKNFHSGKKKHVRPDPFSSAWFAVELHCNSHHSELQYSLWVTFWSLLTLHTNTNFLLTHTYYWSCQ